MLAPAHERWSGVTVITGAGYHRRVCSERQVHLLVPSQPPSSPQPKQNKPHFTKDVPYSAFQLLPIFFQEVVGHKFGITLKILKFYCKSRQKIKSTEEATTPHSHHTHSHHSHTHHTLTHTSHHTLTPHVHTHHTHTHSHHTHTTHTHKEVKNGKGR